MYEIQGKYDNYHGWETVCAEESFHEAKERLAEYLINEAAYHPFPKFRIKKVVESG